MLSTATALDALGLQPGASSDDVRTAYRALIREVHPDLASDEADARRREEGSRLVNRAHEHLLKFGTGSAKRPAPAPPPPSDGPRQPKAEPERYPAAPPSRPASRPCRRRTLTDRMRHSAWLTAVGGAAVLTGLVLRLLHFWDARLTPTSWGDESLAMSTAWILLWAGVGLLTVWGIALIASRPAHLALLIGTVLATSFFELHHRLNWAEIGILIVLLGVWPIWRLLTRP